MACTTYIFVHLLLVLSLSHLPLVDAREVALLQALDDMFGAKDGLESLPEVVDERWLLKVRAARHRCIETRRLLLSLRQLHRLTVVQQLDLILLVLGREHHATVLQCLPHLLAIALPGAATCSKVFYAFVFFSRSEEAADTRCCCC